MRTSLMVVAVCSALFVIGCMFAPQAPFCMIYASIAFAASLAILGMGTPESSKENRMIATVKERYLQLAQQGAGADAHLFLLATLIEITDANVEDVRRRALGEALVETIGASRRIVLLPGLRRIYVRTEEAVIGMYCSWRSLHLVGYSLDDMHGDERMFFSILQRGRDAAAGNVLEPQLPTAVRFEGSPDAWERLSASQRRRHTVTR